MEHKVVAHTKDGTVHKGSTRQFEESAESFYLLPAEGGGVPVRLRIEDLKAVFWVRDFVGNSDFVARRDFEEVNRTGRKVVVTFGDGEQMWGTVSGDTKEGAGFLLYPADRDDNNLKVFVVHSAVENIRFED